MSLTLDGNDTVLISKGSVFNDPGCVEESNTYTVGGATVNVHVAGVYTITYTLNSDSSVHVSRTVIVTDGLPDQLVPYITLHQNPNWKHLAASGYTFTLEEIDPTTTAHISLHGLRSDETEPTTYDNSTTKLAALVTDLKNVSLYNPVNGSNLTSDVQVRVQYRTDPATQVLTESAAWGPVADLDATTFPVPAVYHVAYRYGDGSTVPPTVAGVQRRVVVQSSGLADNLVTTYTVHENTTKVADLELLWHIGTATPVLTLADTTTFEIRDGTELHFKAAPNYEVDSKQYTVAVSGTAHGLPLPSVSVTVNVTDVNERPSFGSDVVTIESFAIGQGRDIQVNAATDEDGDSLYYAIVSGDEIPTGFGYDPVFTMDAATGLLSYTATNGFSTDADGNHSLVVRVRDRQDETAADMLYDDLTLTLSCVRPTLSMELVSAPTLQITGIANVYYVIIRLGLSAVLEQDMKLRFEFRDSTNTIIFGQPRTTAAGTISKDWAFAIDPADVTDGQYTLACTYSYLHHVFAELPPALSIAVETLSLALEPIADYGLDLTGPTAGANEVLATLQANPNFAVDGTTTSYAISSVVTDDGTSLDTHDFVTMNGADVVFGATTTLVDGEPSSLVLTVEATVTKTSDGTVLAAAARPFTVNVTYPTPSFVGYTGGALVYGHSEQDPIQLNTYSGQRTVQFRDRTDASWVDINPGTTLLPSAIGSHTRYYRGDFAGGSVYHTILVTVRPSVVATFDTDYTTNNANRTVVAALDLLQDNPTGIASHTYAIVGGADQDKFEILSSSNLSWVNLPHSADHHVAGQADPEFLVDVKATVNGVSAGQNTTVKVTLTQPYELLLYSHLAVDTTVQAGASGVVGESGASGSSLSAFGSPWYLEYPEAMSTAVFDEVRVGSGVTVMWRGRINRSDTVDAVGCLLNYTDGSTSQFQINFFNGWPFVFVNRTASGRSGWRPDYSDGNGQLQESEKIYVLTSDLSKSGQTKLYVFSTSAGHSKEKEYDLIYAPNGTEPVTLDSPGDPLALTGGKMYIGSLDGVNQFHKGTVRNMRIYSHYQVDGEIQARVKADAFTDFGVTLSPSSVGMLIDPNGNRTTDITVSVNGAPSTDTTLRVSKAGSPSISIPDTITIPAGETQATLTIVCQNSTNGDNASYRIVGATGTVVATKTVSTSTDSTVAPSVYVFATNRPEQNRWVADIRSFDPDRTRDFEFHPEDQTASAHNSEHFEIVSHPVHTTHSRLLWNTHPDYGSFDSHTFTFRVRMVLSDVAGVKTYSSPIQVHVTLESDGFSSPVFDEATVGDIAVGYDGTAVVVRSDGTHHQPTSLLDELTGVTAASVANNSPLSHNATTGDVFIQLGTTGTKLLSLLVEADIPTEEGQHEITYTVYYTNAAGVPAGTTHVRRLTRLGSTFSIVAPQRVYASVQDGALTATWHPTVQVATHVVEVPGTLVPTLLPESFVMEYYHYRPGSAAPVTTGEQALVDSSTQWSLSSVATGDTVYLRVSLLTDNLGMSSPISRQSPIFSVVLDDPTSPVVGHAVRHTAPPYCLIIDNGSTRNYGGAGCTVADDVLTLSTDGIQAVLMDGTSMGLSTALSDHADEQMFLREKVVFPDTTATWDVDRTVDVLRVTASDTTVSVNGTSLTISDFMGRTMSGHYNFSTTVSVSAGLLHVPVEE